MIQRLKLAFDNNSSSIRSLKMSILEKNGDSDSDQIKKFIFFLEFSSDFDRDYKKTHYHFSTLKKGSRQGSRYPGHQTKTKCQAKT